RPQSRAAAPSWCARWCACAGRAPAIPSMPRAAVRPDVHQPLDVHRDLGPKRALDLVVPLDHLTQPRDLRVAQVTNARIRIDAGLRENLLRVSQADAVDVREGVQNFLVAWQVDAR